MSDKEAHDAWCMVDRAGQGRTCFDQFMVVRSVEDGNVLTTKTSFHLKVVFHDIYVGNTS